jgi:hypothetical protein
MKKTIVLLFIFTAFVSNAQSPKEPQNVIVQAFQALSDRNEINLKSFCTDDIIIVEDAKLWNMDSLIFHIKSPTPNDYKRVNSFKFISDVTNDNVSCITYENQADISGNGKHYIIVWIETAILIREDKKWKLKVLHSTTKEKRKI